MNIQSRKICAVMILAATLIAACGGGSSSSPTPAPPVDTPPPPIDGITRTGVVETFGPITGFGSVIVNGNTYDTSSASFTLDGQPATQDDFSVGQMVFVSGSIDDDDTNAVATSVSFDDNVEGPVSSVDELNNTLTVLGQTVIIAASTSVDDSCPADLNAFTGVPAVEVSGPVRADGAIEATRIECKTVAEAGEFEVNGIVATGSLTATTFMINALVVDYSSAMIDNFPGGAISEGDPVEAKGTSLGGGGELIATRVEFKANPFGGNEGDHVEIEGFITSFASSASFSVSGIPVSTDSSTVYEGGTAADLGLNLKVEVEGEFDAGETLVATKVEIKTSTNVRVVGLVDSVSGDTLTILGITVNTDTVKTRFEDKTDADVDPLRIADIAVDNYVETRGQELPAGEITAFLVERDDPRSRTELRGFVEEGGVNEPNLTVLGVTVETDSQTVFRDANEVRFSDPADFWAAVDAGSLINVDGAETAPTTLLAEEVELEME